MPSRLAAPTAAPPGESMGADISANKAHIVGNDML